MNNNRLNDFFESCKKFKDKMDKNSIPKLTQKILLKNYFLIYKFEKKHINGELFCLEEMAHS